MFIPNFRNTEEALSFGKLHKLNSKAKKSLEAKRSELLQEVSAILMNNPTDDEMQIALNKATQAQLCKEALE